MYTRQDTLNAFARLLDVLDELREKCPWDRKQTSQSLRPNTIEEAYELSDAILGGSSQDVCKELGDVLLHVCFHAKIASEKGEFDIADVCNRLCEKLIYRHPHVYGEAKAATAGEVSLAWEKLKRKEKGGNKTTLSGVPSALPSLVKAYRIQEKAANVGFDWERPQDVWGKVREELGELEDEMSKGDRQAALAEYGDFLFALVNAARLYGLNPDTALELANRKFTRRCAHIEAQALAQGRQVADLTLP